MTRRLLSCVVALVVAMTGVLAATSPVGAATAVQVAYTMPSQALTGAPLSFTVSADAGGTAVPGTWSVAVTHSGGPIAGTISPSGAASTITWTSDAPVTDPGTYSVATDFTPTPGGGYATPATANDTVEVLGTNPAPPTVTVSTLPTAPVHQEPFTITAIADPVAEPFPGTFQVYARAAGGALTLVRTIAVTFDASGSGASGTGGTATADVTLDAGDYTVKATIDTDTGLYWPTTSAPLQVSVGRGDDSIAAPTAPEAYPGSDWPIGALKSTAGLDVSVSATSTNSVCSTDAQVVTTVLFAAGKTGVCTVTLSTAGNSTWKPASTLIEVPVLKNTSLTLTYDPATPLDGSDFTITANVTDGNGNALSLAGSGSLTVNALTPDSLTYAGGTATSRTYNLARPDANTVTATFTPTDQAYRASTTTQAITLAAPVALAFTQTTRPGTGATGADTKLAFSASATAGGGALSGTWSITVTRKSDGTVVAGGLDVAGAASTVTWTSTNDLTGAADIGGYLATVVFTHADPDYASPRTDTFDLLVANTNPTPPTLAIATSPTVLESAAPVNVTVTATGGTPALGSSLPGSIVVTRQGSTRSRTHAVTYTNGQAQLALDLSAGTYTIAATIVTDPSLWPTEAAPKDVTVRRTDTITRPADPRAFLGGTWDLSALRSDGGLAVTVQAAGACTVDSLGLVTYSTTTTGSCTLTLSTVGDATWAPTTTQMSFDVLEQSVVTLTYSPSPPVHKEDFTVTATAKATDGTPLGGAGSITVNSSPPAALTYGADGVATSGTYNLDKSDTNSLTVTFTPTDPAYQQVTTTVASLAMADASQTLELPPAPTGAVVGGSWASPTATIVERPGVDAAVISKTTSVCAFTGTTLQYKTKGTCTLEFSAPAVTNYEAAQPLPLSFTIYPRATTLSVGALPVTAYDTSVTINATVTYPGKTTTIVPGTYTFTVTRKNDPSPVPYTAEKTITTTSTNQATWEFNTPGARVPAAGDYSVLVSFSPTDATRYAPPPEVTRSLTVTTASQVITGNLPFDGSEDSFIGETWDLSLTRGTSGQPLVLTNKTPTACSLMDGTVAVTTLSLPAGTDTARVVFAAAGSCEIWVDQAGITGQWESATTAKFPVTVALVPVTVTLTVSPATTTDDSGVVIDPVVGDQVIVRAVAKAGGHANMGHYGSPVDGSGPVTWGAQPSVAGYGATLTGPWSGGGRQIAFSPSKRGDHRASADFTPTETTVYADPAVVSKDFGVGLGTQPITLATAAPAKAYVGQTWAPSPEPGLSGNTPSITSTTGECTTTGGVVTFTVSTTAATLESCKVTFTVDAGGDYAANTEVVTVPVERIPVIMLITPTLDPKVGTSVSLTAQAVSSLDPAVPVGGQGTFTVEDPTDATKSLTLASSGWSGSSGSATFTPTKALTHTARVTFTPSSTVQGTQFSKYAAIAAPGRSRTFAVAKGDQTIDFAEAPPVFATSLDTWQPVITASGMVASGKASDVSGTAQTNSSTDPNAPPPPSDGSTTPACSVDNTMDPTTGAVTSRVVSFTAAGQCWIKWTAQGDANWNPATTYTSTGVMGTNASWDMSVSLDGGQTRGAAITSLPDLPVNVNLGENTTWIHLAAKGVPLSCDVAGWYDRCIPSGQPVPTDPDRIEGTYLAWIDGPTEEDGPLTNLSGGWQTFQPIRPASIVPNDSPDWGHADLKAPLDYPGTYYIHMWMYPGGYPVHSYVSRYYWVNVVRRDASIGVPTEVGAVVGQTLAPAFDTSDATTNSQGPLTTTIAANTPATATGGTVVCEMTPDGQIAILRDGTCVVKGTQARSRAFKATTATYTIRASRTTTETTMGIPPGATVGTQTTITASAATKEGVPGIPGTFALYDAARGPDAYATVAGATGQPVTFEWTPIRAGSPTTTPAPEVKVVFTPTDTVTYSPSEISHAPTVDKATTAISLDFTTDSVSAQVSIPVTRDVPMGSVVFRSATTPEGLATAPETTVDMADGVATWVHGLSPTTAFYISATYGGDANLKSATTEALRDVPTITARVTSTASPTQGWYREPVTVLFTCTSSTALTAPCPAPVVLSTDGVDQSVSRTVVALDGGRASVTSPPVSIDQTAPAVEVSGPVDGAWYRGKAPTPTCVSTDPASGVASCTIAHEQLDVDNHLAVATSTDTAGNTATVRVRYQIRTTWVVNAPLRNNAFRVRARKRIEVVALTRGPQPQLMLPRKARKRPTIPGPPMVAVEIEDGVTMWVARYKLPRKFRKGQLVKLGIKDRSSTMKIVRIRIR